MTVAVSAESPSIGTLRLSEQRPNQRVCFPGRLNLKSLACQHIFKIGFIVGCDEVFVSDADFFGRLVFAQAQCPSINAEVLIDITPADAAEVLAERHVELPLPAVFDAPNARDPAPHEKLN